jgi:hypothetical protein
VTFLRTVDSPAVKSTLHQIWLAGQVSLCKVTQMKLSFSLTSKKPVGDAPSLKRPAAFTLADDENAIDAAAASPADRTAAPNAKLLAQNVGSSKAMKKRMAAEKKIDETVYEYDEVWEKMQEAKLKQKEAKEADAKERKVCPDWVYQKLSHFVSYSPNISVDCSILPQHASWTIFAQRRK